MKKMKGKKKEKLTAVRTARFEVHTVENADWKETKKRWRGLGMYCQQMMNCVWQQWLIWHIQNGSESKIREWLEARSVEKEMKESINQVEGQIKNLHRRIKKSPRQNEAKRAELKALVDKKNKLMNRCKPAGKCPVECLSKKLDNDIYHFIAERFPEAHSRVNVLLRNTWQRTLRSRKAAKGKLPGWMAILLCNESIPSFKHPVPIPFDRANAVGGGLTPPAVVGDNYKIKLRLSRTPSDNDSPSPSIVDNVVLRCRGRKVSGQVHVLNRIVSGEYEFRGSELLYDSSKKKWFVLVAYRMPAGKKYELDKSRVAVLRPAKHRPFKLRLPRKNREPMPRGDFVGHVRRRLLTGRWSRQQNYKFASTANKGHGRKRALDPLWQLSQVWKYFVKRCNHEVSRDVVNQLIDHDVGILYYRQPKGEFAESRYLTTVGKDKRKKDSTGWEWFQLGTMLDYKCKEVGIELRLLVDKLDDEKEEVA